jgi:hypothetical protein
MAWYNPTTWFKKKINNFIKKFEGELLVSVPIKVPARKK